MFRRIQRGEGGQLEKHVRVAGSFQKKEDSEYKAFPDMIFVQGPVIPMDLVLPLTERHPPKPREIFPYISHIFFFFFSAGID